MDRGETQRADVITPPSRLALGVWLAFMVVTLSSLLIFFSLAPELSGPGHGAIVAVGTTAGLLAAAAVGRVRRDMWRGQSIWGHAKLTLGLILGGTGGGAAAAELLNLSLPPGAATVIERPIVGRSIDRGRYGRRWYRVTTLGRGPAPAIAKPTLDAQRWATATPGRCLMTAYVRGRLGGEWVASRRVATCTPRRGRSGDRVIVDANSENWRWHSASWQRIGVKQAIDLALPPGSRCRTYRSATWLYRC
jgi:hypothetical protein